MSLGPKSLVFTTARVRNSHVFHFDLHEKRLRKHGEKLGLNSTLSKFLIVKMGC